MKRRQAGDAHRPSAARWGEPGAATPPIPAEEALADRAFMDGVRQAMAATEPPVPLRDTQEQERAQRAARRV
jgi:hypothetical protein